MNLKISIVLLIQITNLEICLTQEFDSKYFGVAFSPFTRHWNKSNPATSPRDCNYDITEVEAMLKKISEKFTNIFTYNMGVTNESGNGIIGRTAAKLNKDEGKIKISLLQGINLLPDQNLQDDEINNAIQSINFSNNFYNQTITELIFVNDTNQSDPESLKNGIHKATYFGVVNLLKKYNDSLRSLGVRIGVRVHDCEQIFNGSNKEDLARLAKLSDFIMCVMHFGFKIFNSSTEGRSPSFAVKYISDSYQKIQNRYKEENKKLEIVAGDFGWPSKGNSFNKAPGSSENLNLFWKTMNAWATKSKVRVFLFEAFDEPWRSDFNNREDIPKGKIGALGHYGWWTRAENNSIDYFEKIPKSALEIKSDNKLLILIVGIVIMIIVLSIIPFAYLNRRFRLTGAKKFNRLSNDDIEFFYNGSTDVIEIHENQNEIAILRPYERKYEISKDSMIINKSKILGGGAFGIVYEGRIKGINEKCAFKTVKSTGTTGDLKSLMAEIKIMSYIGKHQSIASLIGAYTAELNEGIVYLVVELCTNGSLERYLRREKFEKVDNDYVNIQPEIAEQNIDKIKTIRKEMLKWSTQIANGMEFIEDKKVIHADLASRNILLTGDMNIKITDFGLSRRLYEYSFYLKKNEVPLPWRWMAIETLQTMKFSHASDVWSFGVTLWEIFSAGGLPFPGLAWNMFFIEQLEEGLRLPKPRFATNKIYETMRKCWQLDPESRPNFNQLFNSLRHLMDLENL